MLNTLPHPKPKPTKGIKIPHLKKSVAVLSKKKKKSSGGIKITNPDKWFSLCVRERADWTCQRCGRKFPEEYSIDGLPKAQGLDCSHFIGRGNWSVRHDPLDADAHCRGCHGYFEANPHLFTEWKKERLGSLYEILIEKSNNVMLGKQARKEKNEIAEHYKAEFFRMRELRNKGVIGRINFQGYF